MRFLLQSILSSAGACGWNTLNDLTNSPNSITPFFLKSNTSKTCTFSKSQSEYARKIYGKFNTDKKPCFTCENFNKKFSKSIFSRQDKFCSQIVQKYSVTITIENKILQLQNLWGFLRTHGLYGVPLSHTLISQKFNL